MESPPFTLGETDMKFTPALLLCAVFLIAALPIRADSLSYTGTSNDSPNTENSAPEFRASATKMLLPATPRVISDSLSAVDPVRGHEIAYLALPAESSITALSATTFGTSARRLDAPQIDGQLSDPTPAITSIRGFESGSAFAAWGSEPSFVVGTVFPPSSDTSLHSTTITELGSEDPTLSVFATEGARHKIDRERGKSDNGMNQHQNASPSVEVPEPGALPLLLFGLAAVAIVVRRRSVFLATT
jgi:hypothetical protein